MKAIEGMQPQVDDFERRTAILAQVDSEVKSIMTVLTAAFDVSGMTPDGERRRLLTEKELAVINAERTDWRHRLDDSGPSFRAVGEEIMTFKPQARACLVCLSASRQSSTCASRPTHPRPPVPPPS